MVRDILVVDDSATFRNMAQIMVRSRPDVVLHLAASGLEAGHILLANPQIKAVLLDLNMPGMGGLEVLEDIRSLGGHYAEIPILVMSSDDREPGIATALQNGADGYLKKPFTLAKVTELFEKLRKHPAVSGAAT